MPNLFPGAVWRPMPGQEKRPARRKGRGVGLHVAVYTGPSIYDINTRTGNDAHLYVRLDGSVEQNVDLDRQAWAGVDGNPSMIWVETAGGVDPVTVNTEQWTAAQAATLARIARWAHDTEGVPLQVMPDSKPASRGIGTHRLGIQHSRGVGAVPGWLVAGGERWSSVLGKECPGNAKVAQVPSIVTRAQQIVQGDDMPLDANDLQNVQTQAYFGFLNAVADLNNAQDPTKKRDAALSLLAEGARRGVPTSAAVTVDAAALAEALLADPASVDRLGAAIAAHLKLTSG